MSRPAGLDKHAREQMLDRAVCVAAREGFYTTTIRHLEVPGEFSEARYYKYFGSKDGLLCAMHERFWCGLYNELPEEVKDGQDPVQKMRATLHTLVSFADRHRDLVQVILTTIYPKGEKKSRKLNDFRSRVRRYLMHAIGEARAHGHLRDPKVPDVAVYEAISGSVQQLLEKRYSGSKRGSRSITLQELERSMDCVLSGFFILETESKSPLRGTVAARETVTDELLSTLLAAVYQDPEDRLRAVNRLVSLSSKDR